MREKIHSQPVSATTAPTSRRSLPFCWLSAIPTPTSAIRGGTRQIGIV
ncbi:MAG TPA: hypothetical protein VG223_08395 [Solirubrobacteraceae bacterium]|jgi:hypothetical protein|nr:hypothetical protein [Solirubrobacteraceae bacterium]